MHLRNGQSGEWGQCQGGGQLIDNLGLGCTGEGLGQCRLRVEGKLEGRADHCWGDKEEGAARCGVVGVEKSPVFWGEESNLSVSCLSLRTLPLVWLRVALSPGPAA